MNPKEALQQWANQNGITPPDFARTMGYSYNHAYQLLRGEAEVKIEMLGRFVVAYGTEASKPIAEAFSLHTDMDGAVVKPAVPTTRKPRKARKATSKKAISAIPGVQRGLKQQTLLEAA